MDHQPYLSKTEFCALLSKIDFGLKLPGDDYFINCDRIQRAFVKQGILAIEDEGNKYVSSNSVPCNVHGCNEIFDTVFAYESHYNALHRFLCNLCKKNLPSSHLLDLHLSEKHDSFFAAQAEHKPMYSCYIQECQKKCTNPEERTDHCIRVHKFPANFRFETSLVGSGATKKIKKQKQKKAETAAASDETTKTKSFTFGQQKTKVFNESSSYAKVLTKSKSKKKNPKSLLDDDNNAMSDLMETLP